MIAKPKAQTWRADPDENGNLQMPHPVTRTKEMRMRSRSIWFVLPVFLGLIGCETMERIGNDSVPAAPIALPPAEQPVYEPGQVFVYERDRVRQVAWVNDGEIQWTDRDEPLYRTSEHFFLPRVFQDFRDRTVRRVFSGDPSALWPLAVGKQVFFVERRKTAFKDTQKVNETTRHWQCSVDDSRVSQTLAGPFDSYRVTCRSYRLRLGSRPGLSLVQVVRWDYAPKMRHYVLRESWLPRSDRHHTSTLSAALPASLATPERIDALLSRLANDGE